MSAMNWRFVGGKAAARYRRWAKRQPRSFVYPSLLAAIEGGKVRIV